MCGAAAHNDRRLSGVPDAGSMVRAWASSFFASRQAISSLTSRGNQPMFYPGPAGAAKIIRDSRAAGFDLSI
jgi:hypothetical protein